MRSFILASILVTAALVAPIARAQDNSATVEALFNEGKRLKDQGNFSEACPKFLASYNLEKRLGTLLNLADCYERNGQLASAWARFVEAHTAALRANQDERAKFAADHASALEPKLSKLAVAVSKPVAGLVVKLDGAIVDPGAYRVSLAADAGTHKVEAQAPDKKPWSAEVIVGANGDKKTLEVPELEDLPKADAGQADATMPRAAPDAPVEAKSGGMSARGITGLVIAGVGVVGLGVGAYFGVTALGKKSDSSPFCGQNGAGPNDCNAQGVALRSDAMSAGTISTVFIVAGGVATVAGLVVFLTAPSSKAKAAVGFDGRMLTLGGAF